MTKTKLAIIIISSIMVCSLIANVVLQLKLIRANKKSQELSQSIHTNTAVLSFAQLFIEKVLKAQGEISFEDRLKVENSVRDTQDKDIYEEWQKFVGSNTEDQGREEIKNLLQLIINKLSQ